MPCHRCDLVEGQQAADLRIHLHHSTVQEVQVKTGRNADRALKHPKYEGMQKVVPEGMENAQKGYSSQVRCGQVASDSLSNADAYSMVRDPQQHFDSMRPSVVADVLRCGLGGAALGGLYTAAVAAVMTYFSKGSIDSQDGRAIGEAAAVGAVSSGVGSAVTAWTGDAMGGGIASGAILMAYNMLKCDDSACRVREGAQGVAGTSAALTAGAAVSPAVAATGPLGFVLCPAAVWAASWRARMATKAVVERLQGEHCSPTGPCLS
jgi:hypothetical protein